MRPRVPLWRIFALAALISTSTAHASPLGPEPATPEASPWLPRGEAERLAEVPLGRAVWRPGRGLEIASADRRFSLNINAWAHLRYTAGREAIPAAGADPWTQTLELRSAQVMLSGRLLAPHIDYTVVMMFSPRDLGFKNGAPRRPGFYQAFMSWTRFQHANVHLGYFFIPYARQRMRPLTRLQLVDSSAANYEFTLEQDIGVQVNSPDIAGLDRLRYFAGVFMGEGDEWHRASDFGFTYIGRVDYLPLGLFDDYSEADHERGIRPRLSIGGAYAFNDRERRTRALGGTTFADGGSARSHNLTADLMFKVAGFSTLLDFYWRQGRRLPGDAKDMFGEPVAVEAARNGFGFTAQLGLFVPRTRLEFTTRVSGVRPARQGPTSLGRLDEHGGGLNYYFVRHAFKLQADYFRTRGPGLPAGVADQIRVQLRLSF